MSRAFSLRRRLTLSMLLTFVLGFSIAILFFLFEAYETSRELRFRSLQGQAQELVSAVGDAADRGVRIDLPPSWQAAYERQDSSFYYTIYGADGRPEAVSPNLEQPLPLLEINTAEDAGRVHLIGPEPWWALAMRAPEGRTAVVARSAPETEALAESLVAENLEHLLVLVPFVLISAALIWTISGWSLRPLRRASEAAMQVGPADPSARIDAEGLPAEIRPLVIATNDALERLARAYIAERRLTADAAHELRTPLAVLGLRLQKAKLGAAIDWTSIEKDLAQLNQLIGQLLGLARVDSASHAAGRAKGASVNLSRVVREAAALVLPLADEAGREIDVVAPDAVPVIGNADHLRDMVRNLLDNALTHGRGAIRVRVESHTEEKGAHAASIVVSDEGEGVPEGLEDEVFDRFRKARAASPGAGLGLAIVRQVARGHGGEARLVPGPGCCIEVSLPQET